LSADVSSQKRLGGWLGELVSTSLVN